MTAKHTPTPWEAKRDTGHAHKGWNIWKAVGGTEFPIANLPWGDPIDEANAAHIVRCVNAHDELVAVLVGILERASIDADDGALALHALSDIRAEARAILAKVRS